MVEAAFARPLAMVTAALAPERSGGAGLSQEASSSLPPIRSPSTNSCGVVDAMLLLEGLDLVARGEQPVVEGDAGILEHPLGQQAIGAFVVGQLHSIEDDGTLGHGNSLLTDVPTNACGGAKLPHSR